jgi:general stress protein YciG
MATSSEIRSAYLAAASHAAALLADPPAGRHGDSDSALAGHLSLSITLIEEALGCPAGATGRCRHDRALAQPAGHAGGRHTDNPDLRATISQPGGRHLRHKADITRI